ncbi:Cation-transporting ATPase [Hirschfeldia incana]|nr:Cation-transporting ATPase [Hirschfeldia incana]
MGEQNGVSRGFSFITRSDLKIGDNELDENQKLTQIGRVNPIINPGNSVHASKDIEKTNEMPQVCNNKMLSSQEVMKPYSDKLTGGALVKSNAAESVALKRCGPSVSSFSNGTALSSVCSSGRGDKPGPRDVNSECGSCSNASVGEKDPMKLWEAMKQNGFLSNPHGGVSGTSSSCVVSSSHGGIPAPRKRGRKSKNNDNAAMVKKRKIEIARKEEVDRFARLAAPSGLLNELNPGIINHVRNKKQVLSIIQSIVKSDKDSGDYHHSTRLNNTTAAGASSSDFNQGFKCGMPEDNYYHEEKCADGEENSKFSENASSLSSEDAASLNRDSVLTVKAATVASQWLELLHQDIKCRVSALRRSKKRVRAVVTTELPFLISKEFPADQENDPSVLFNGSSRASTVDNHKNRWMALFKQLEQTLSEEERQLECWLSRVKELQSHCDQGLQHLSLSSGQNFLQLGMPLYSRAADSLISDKDLAVRAAAASIYSTSNFLASEENITCT